MNPRAPWQARHKLPATCLQRSLRGQGLAEAMGNSLVDVFVQTLNACAAFTSPNPEHSDRVCSPQTLNAGTPNPERSDTQTLNACAGKPSNINRQTNRQDINPPYPPQQAVRATTSSQQQVASTRCLPPPGRGLRTAMASSHCHT